MGIASILAGLVNPHLAHRFGRPVTAWIGIGFFSVGLVAFVASPSVLFSIPAALIAGFGVSITINNAITAISTHYKEMSPMALTQANAIASCGYVSGTLIVGTIANTYRDFWRFGMLIALPLAAFLFFGMRDKTTEVHVPHEDGSQSGKLSRAFWISWVGYVACISSEFAISFWAAALIIDRTGATPAISTLTVAALGTGMALGRWYGGRILKRWSLDTQLNTFIGIQAVGFAIVWFSLRYERAIFAAIVALAMVLGVREMVNALKSADINLSFPALTLASIGMAVAAWFGGVNGLAVATAIALPLLLALLLPMEVGVAQDL
jgi:MFS family permease